MPQGRTGCQSASRTSGVGRRQPLLARRPQADDVREDCIADPLVEERRCHGVERRQALTKGVGELELVHMVDGALEPTRRRALDGLKKGLALHALRTEPALER